MINATKPRTTAHARAMAAIERAADEVLSRSRIPLHGKIEVATKIHNLAAELATLVKQAFPSQ